MAEKDEKTSQLCSSPIHQAAFSGDVASLTALVGKNEQMVHSSNSWGSTPLHSAAANNQVLMQALAALVSLAALLCFAGFLAVTLVITLAHPCTRCIP